MFPVYLLRIFASKKPDALSCSRTFAGLRSLQKRGDAKHDGICSSGKAELFPAIRLRCLQTSCARLKKRAEAEPPPRELDLLRYDMKSFWQSPRAPLYLGLGGLLPFVFPPLLMAVTETFYPQLAFAQVAYGASVLAFQGGARWGFALPESSPARPDWINLANGVVPPLLAWSSMLMIDSLVPAAMLVVMGMGISLHYDLSLLPTYPPWFKAHRAAATLTAFFSLTATLLMNGVYPEKLLTA